MCPASFGTLRSVQSGDGEALEPEPVFTGRMVANSYEGSCWPRFVRVARHPLRVSRKPTWGPIQRVNRLLPGNVPNQLEITWPIPGTHHPAWGYF
jgi:hypothetical protein